MHAPFTIDGPLPRAKRPASSSSSLSSSTSSSASLLATSPSIEKEGPAGGSSRLEHHQLHQQHQGWPGTSTSYSSSSLFSSSSSSISAATTGLSASNEPPHFISTWFTQKDIDKKRWALQALLAGLALRDGNSIVKACAKSLLTHSMPISDDDAEDVYRSHRVNNVTKHSHNNSHSSSNRSSSRSSGSGRARLHSLLPISSRTTLLNQHQNEQQLRKQQQQQRLQHVQHQHIRILPQHHRQQHSD